MPKEPTKDLVEEACRRFLELGVGPGGNGSVVIRSGAMGACIATRGTSCTWVDAFWTDDDAGKVVDVTGRFRYYPTSGTWLMGIPAGAGNAFLGGLGAGLVLANGDVHEGKP